MKFSVLREQKPDERFWWKFIYLDSFLSLVSLQQGDFLALYKDSVRCEITLSFTPLFISLSKKQNVICFK
jgi:hypothetical protein